MNDTVIYIACVVIYIAMAPLVAGFVSSLLGDAPDSDDLVGPVILSFLAWPIAVAVLICIGLGILGHKIGKGIFKR